jgi:hypothetical protein
VTFVSPEDEDALPDRKPKDDDVPAPLTSSSPERHNLTVCALVPNEQVSFVFPLAEFSSSLARKTYRLVMISVSSPNGYYIILYSEFPASRSTTQAYPARLEEKKSIN